jgi:IMP dehydrogenase
MMLLRAVKSHSPLLQQETSDPKDRPQVAVSFSAFDVATVPDFVEAGADAIVLESAHAGNTAFIEAVAAVRKMIPSTIAFLAGNIAGADAAARLRDAGVDAVKVGVGVGSMCTTTEVTGIGMPQISALAEVTDSLKGSGVAIIADGGIRTGGDIVKSFAVGAAAVCIGSLFAQSLEAAGDSMVDEEGRSLRKYSANFYPSLAYKRKGKVVAGEGMEGWLTTIGSVEEIVDRLSTAVRAGMAYIGAPTIPDVANCARFIFPISGRAADERRRQPPITDLHPLSAPDIEANVEAAEGSTAVSNPSISVVRAASGSES